MPPDERGGAPTPESASHHLRRQSLIEDQHPQRNAPTRQCRGNTVGRYASGWRAGFSAGAIDALRLAARRIDDPYVWLVLDELRECYETEQWGLAG